MRARVLTLLLLFLGAWSTTAWADLTAPVCLVYRSSSSTQTGSDGDWNAKATLTEGTNEYYVTINGSELGCSGEKDVDTRCFFGFKTENATGWDSGKKFYVSTTGSNTQVLIDGAAISTQYAYSSSQYSNSSLFTVLPNDKNSHTYTFHFDKKEGYVWVSEGDVASVTAGTTTTNYTSFSEALAAANAAGTATISLLKDCIFPSTYDNAKFTGNITIEGGSYTLDVTGYGLSINGNITINSGTFKLTSCTTNQKLFMVNSGGTLTVNGGTLSTQTDADVVYVYSNGTFIANGGTFAGASDKSGTRGLNTDANFHVTLNGGTFSGSGLNGGAIYLANSVAVSTILGTGKGYYSSDGSTTFDVSSNSINTTVTVKDAKASVSYPSGTYTITTYYETFDKALTAVNSISTSDISPAIITLLNSVNQAGFTAPEEKHIAIEGGSYTMTLTGNVTVSGDLYINSGTFKATSAATGDHIFTVNGTMKVNGGTIDASATAEDAIGVSAGANFYASAGTITGGTGKYGLYLGYDSNKSTTYGNAHLSGGTFSGGTGAISIHESNEKKIVDILESGYGYYQYTDGTWTAVTETSGQSLTGTIKVASSAGFVTLKAYRESSHTTEASAFSYGNVVYLNATSTNTTSGYVIKYYFKEPKGDKYKRILNATNKQLDKLGTYTFKAAWFVSSTATDSIVSPEVTIESKPYILKVGDSASSLTETIETTDNTYSIITTANKVIKYLALHDQVLNKDYRFDGNIYRGYDFSLKETTTDNPAFALYTGYHGTYKVTAEFDATTTSSTTYGQPKMKIEFPSFSGVIINNNEYQFDASHGGYAGPFTLGAATGSGSSMTPAEATFELYWKGARYTFTSGQISYIGAEASTDYKNVYFAPAQSTTKVTNIHGAKITVAADYYLAVTDSSNLDNIKVSGFYPTVLLIKESSGTVKTVPMNDVTYSGENATFKNSITLTGTQGTTIGAQFVYDGQYYGWSDANAPTLLEDRVDAQSIKVTGQYSDSWLQLSPWITGGYTVSCVVTGTTNPTMTLSIECTSPTEYTRTVTSGNYGSICLPSAVASSAMTGIENIYSVSAVGTSSVTLTPVTTGMVAGTPYLFKSNASTVHFTFNGDRVDQPVSAPYLVGNFIAHNAYAGTHVPEGCYVLQTQNGVQAFRQVASGNTTFLSGRFRCYLDTSKSTVGAAKAATLGITFDGESTAIDALNAVMNNEAVIYDLNGRRLPSLQKGINIVNGKKIIVK